jgi:hypothetical protein
MATERGAVLAFGQDELPRPCRLRRHSYLSAFAAVYLQHGPHRYGVDDDVSLGRDSFHRVVQEGVHFVEQAELGDDPHSVNKTLRKACLRVSTCSLPRPR